MKSHVHGGIDQSRDTTDVFWLLDRIFTFMKKCRKEDDLRYEEYKKDKKETAELMEKKQKLMDEWSKKNVEEMVKGMVTGFERSGVKTLADAYKKKEKEEQEWRDRIGLSPK